MFALTACSLVHHPVEPNERIAIIGLPQETEGVTQLMTGMTEAEISGLDVTEGTLRGNKVVLARVGVGKAAAAMAATALTERYHLRAIVFIGTAGALDPAFVPGDVVLGAQTGYHDFGLLTRSDDQSQSVFIPWRARDPLTGGRHPLFFSADGALLRAARGAATDVSLVPADSRPGVRQPKIHEGVIVTGDVVISDSVKRAELRMRTGGDAVETEGAAIAEVCTYRRVPCLIVRSISDRADRTSVPDYYAFRKIASANAAVLLSAIVDRLAQKERSHKENAASKVRWRVLLELAFADGSPYEEQFSSLAKLSLASRVSVWRSILDNIVRLAVSETGVTARTIQFLPASFADEPVVPSAQFEVEATETAMADTLAIIGYLTQQGIAVAVTESPEESRTGLRIVEHGGRRLARPDDAREFWQALWKKEPKLSPGFWGYERDGEVGLFIVDVDGDWFDRDIPGFVDSIRAVSATFGLTTSTMIWKGSYLELINNWRAAPRGDAYLRLLARRGRQRLVERLVDEYAADVARSLKGRLQGHVPPSPSDTQAEPAELRQTR